MKAAAASLCCALILGGTAPAAAQPEVERGPEANVSNSRVVFAHESFVQFRNDGWGREVLRVGQTYELKEGETIREVISVFGPATINGTVRGDVTVVLGTVTIGPSAVIEGSLVAVGGNVTVQDGAAVHSDMIVVGGGVNAPPNFAPGRQHVAIGGTAIANRLNSAIPWLTEGLLLGRPLVPRLSWVWVVVGISLIASLLLALLFADSVRMCADAIAARPFTTFLVGLLVLVLTGPVTVVLIASVVGVLVVPFALCALVIAWMIGKVGVTVRVGDIMSGQTSPASRLLTVRSLLLGFAAIMLIYMVPVLGLLAWSVVGVTGLGAATLAFSSAYRRENPARPKPPKPVPTPPPAGPGEPTPAPESFAPGVAPGVVLQDSGVGPAVMEPSAVSTSNLLGFPKAGFAERAAAFALDTIFVLIICGALGVFEHDDEGVVILALLAYHIGFWAWKGTTFGGIVCQLRVIRYDGTPLRFVDALVRGIAGIFSLAVLGLGCLWIVRDEERQSWHDKIAGTYVVSVPRNWPV
jgi:uncharacterized RDD family membrane protein YckC